VVNAIAKVPFDRVGIGRPSIAADMEVTKGRGFQLTDKLVDMLFIAPAHVPSQRPACPDTFPRSITGAMKISKAGIGWFAFRMFWVLLLLGLSIHDYWFDDPREPVEALLIAMIAVAFAMQSIRWLVRREDNG
jgi:hypothetical protein